MKKSITSLKRHKQFAPLIKKHGRPTLKPGTNYFQSLCSSIISQQLSGKAADTIYARFVSLFGTRFPAPQQVLDTPHEKLRSVGLSNQKVSYIHNVARVFVQSDLKSATIKRLSNDEIIAQLTKIKGVGVWTAHMFLIFTLNRLDVLPTGDLGIRKGFQIVYNLRALPSPSQMERLAKPWREHASVASWYLWRAADEAKK
jgi:DNA-3-methyladenine glycosylase II